MENSDDGVIEEVESSNGSRKENSNCAKKKSMGFEDECEAGSVGIEKRDEKQRV